MKVLRAGKYREQAYAVDEPTPLPRAEVVPRTCTDSHLAMRVANASSGWACKHCFVELGEVPRWWATGRPPYRRPIEEIREATRIRGHAVYKHRRSRLV